MSDHCHGVEGLRVGGVNQRDDTDCIRKEGERRHRNDMSCVISWTPCRELNGY